MSILGDDTDEMIALLSSLNEEEMKIVKELFVGISKRLNSKKFIDYIESLKNKFTNINFNSIIFFCKLNLLEK